MRRLGWAGALAVVWAGCEAHPVRPSPGAPREPGAPRAVQTAPVTERRLARTIVALGTLASHEQATLSAKVPGRLESLKVDLGQRVRRGEVLAQIEPRDYQLKVQQAAAALAQARAALGLPLEGENDQFDPETVNAVKEARAVLDEARASLERTQQLLKDKIASAAQLDTAQSGYLVALNRHQDALNSVRQKQALLAQRRVELEIARQQSADTTLIAPFDGGIQDRRADEGEYLTLGAPILTLVRLDPLRLRVEVSERDAPKVRLGQTVRFAVEGEAQPIAGTLQRISPALDPTNRMLVVEADIQNDGRLHPGYFARAEIVITPDAPALTIPTNAVVAFAGLEKVFVVRTNRAAERRVGLGQAGQDWVEVVSGLTPGEQVILHPGNLQSGAPVVPGAAAVPTRPPAP